MAKQMHHETVKNLHKGLEFIRCGLLIDKEYPFIGASTDGLIKCYYCGKALWKNILWPWTFQKQIKVKCIHFVKKVCHSESRKLMNL